MKRSFRSLLVMMTLAFLSASCSTTSMTETAPPAEGTAPEVEPSYDRIIESFSAGDSEYSGFYNNFEYKATLLNSSIRSALLNRQASYYQWEREKTLAEREKQQKEMAAETEVFVSFFTPDRKNDNLSDLKTIWRVYLEAGGRRYQGKVKKVRLLLAELQTLYPYHTRWNTPYSVSFSVPTTAIESQTTTLTITGPLGTRAVNFPAVK